MKTAFAKEIDAVVFPARSSRSRVASILARLSIAGVVLFLSLMAFRAGIILFVHGRVASASGDLARVGGFDPRISTWLEGSVAWTLTFAIASILLRTIWQFMVPFGKPVLRAPLILLGLTGLGAFLPSTVQSFRGVDSNGLPAQMTEIKDPSQRRWFDAAGKALIFFSREFDDRLRFWDREGLTPDRRVESRAATAAIRLEWEAGEAKKAEQARARAPKEVTPAPEVRPLPPAKEVGRQPEETRPRGLADAPRHKLDQSPFDPLDKAAPTPAPMPPAPAPRPPMSEPSPRLWVRYRLVPGMLLHLKTYGRPCSIRTDTAIEVFPNHPSFPRRVMAARSGLRFSRGPITVNATPLGMNHGTIELRFDD